MPNRSRYHHHPLISLIRAVLLNRKTLMPNYQVSLDVSVLALIEKGISVDANSEPEAKLKAMGILGDKMIASPILCHDQR
jgi:hypothetical protein